MQVSLECNEKYLTRGFHTNTVSGGSCIRSGCFHPFLRAEGDEVYGDAVQESVYIHSYPFIKGKQVIAPSHGFSYQKANIFSRFIVVYPEGD